MRIRILLKESVLLLFLLFAVGWYAKATESRDGEFIVFADSNVKALCVANWDANEDGELSYAEAAAVTDLGYVFQRNEIITSFDELQNFTGLTSLVYEGDWWGTFYGCTNLTSIIIPNSVTTIGGSTFEECTGLSSIVIPNSVTSIGDYAFYDCTSLTSITIPNSVNEIGEGAFAESGLISINIPNSVSSIGSWVLGGCVNLEQIIVEEGNPAYDSRGNCNAIIETETNTLIVGCMNTIIPGSVTGIGSEAFAGCTGLTSVIIPSSVEYLGDWAFAGCTGLTSMIMFNLNMGLGEGVFNNVTILDDLFVSASASPAEGGGVLGIIIPYDGNVDNAQAFIGTFDMQNYAVEFVTQGNGQLSSYYDIMLAAHPNDGWQFAGWSMNGELVSYETMVSFRGFGSFSFEALFETCGFEPDPDLLDGRFSISGCSTVGFAKSNAIMKGNLMELMSDPLGTILLTSGIALPGITLELGENQWDCMTYDSTAIVSDIYSYYELMMTSGVDVFPNFYIKGNIDCWHILTGSEWDYLLNQRDTESGVRFVYAKVNDVNGLVILPDDWGIGTYPFANINEVADYQNNVITANAWLTTLEPSGAVFLPVNGLLSSIEALLYMSGNGKMGAYPGLFISPNGSLLSMELPMTGDVVNVLTSFYGTSLRLAQITETSTVNISVAVAAEQQECGVVTGGGEVSCGQTCTVTATANPGYVFQYWKENGQIVSTETIYSFKATSNRDLVAQFANVDEVCNVVFALSGQVIGWGGEALNVNYGEGEGAVSFQLTMPTPETLSFMELYGLMGESSQIVTQFYSVFIDRNASVNLSWQDAVGITGNSAASFAIYYEDGETILEGNKESLSMPFSFVCTCEEVSCSIVANVVPSGYGWVTGNGTYPYGTTCTLSAEADDHYHFTGWKENGLLVCETPVYTFTVTSNRTLEATFAVNGYYMFSLAVEPEEGGALYSEMYYQIETPYETEEPVEETDISVVAKANEGWRFAYWTANGEMVPANSVYTFHLSENTDLVAHFEQCELELEPDPELLTGRFSISGCTTVGFAKGNVIAQIQMDTIYYAEPNSNIVTAHYNPTSASWQFAETQYYRQEYDAGSIAVNGYSDLLAEGMDLVWDVHRSLGLVDIACWHNLSGAEWEYLLNGRPTAVRYAFAKVNDVDGLLVLPDDWVASTFTLDAPNTVASYETNTISLMDWENTLEPAGALFLPANGALNAQTNEYFVGLDENGIPMGLYGKMLFHPEMGIMDSETVPLLFVESAMLSSSLRLAQIVEQETSTVSVETMQTNRGTVTGGGNFTCGAECTVSAVANEGYVFQYWTEGGSVVSVDNPYVFNVEGDRNLTAVFADANDVCNVEFELFCDVGGLIGWGGVALQLNFDDGSPSVSLTVPAPEIDWNTVMIATLMGQQPNINDFNIPQSCTFTFPINKETNVELSWIFPSINMGMNLSNTFTASYVMGNTIIENAGSDNLPYTFLCDCEGFAVALNLSVEPEEGGTATAEGFPYYGETVTLTAEANEGYHFVNWTFNGAEVSTEPTYSFVAMEDGDLVAHFGMNSYEVIAVANPEEGGTVTKYTYTNVVFELFDSYGDGWNGNRLLVYVDGSQLPYAYLTMNNGYSTTTNVNIPPGSNVSLGWSNGNYTYECSFDVYYEDGTLIYHCSSPSTSLPYEFVCAGDPDIHYHGSRCAVEAVPNNGYTFINWTENGEEVSTDSWYSFTVTMDRELVANFSLPVTITAIANPSEGGTVSGAGIYEFGTQCTLTATPNEGFVFSAWTEDGETVSTDADYSFSVTQERNLVAVFSHLYNITATPNPSEGGTVSGGGVFVEDSTCTLTAVANIGYDFVNWSLDGTIVSTDSTYIFTVTGAGDYVANFSLKNYDVTVTVTPAIAGSVTGTGNYNHGTECTLMATPNENYTFLYWTEDDAIVSSNATYSFIVTTGHALVAHFVANTQSFSLNSGWTWISTFIEQEGIDGLSMLEEGLNPNGVMIKSQSDGFLVYDAGMWIGLLDAITNEKTYLVNTSGASEFTLMGTPANVTAHPITLNPNWTWIGYPLSVAMDINEALANLNPSEGDLLKSHSCYAIYDVEDGWFGSLNTLNPGEGLMYQSHNTQAITFTYSYGMSRSLKANLTAENNHWVPDIHAYPNNMNIIAVVELDGEELQDERYELAVFSGDECRGSARLVYVESMRRHVAFLTVAGEEDTELCLALYDTMTGEAYFNTTDCLNFETNAVLGSFHSPYVARFGGTTGMDEDGGKAVILYPNPVPAGHLFQMELPAESEGVRVSIINTLGTTVSTTDVYAKPATLRAPAVPGVYTVRVVMGKEGTYSRKLIVK